MLKSMDEQLKSRLDSIGILLGIIANELVEAGACDSDVKSTNCKTILSAIAAFQE